MKNNVGESREESYVTTNGTSATLSWRKAPIWGTVAGLLMWGTLSDERTGLSFTISAGPRQSSHSRVRAPWDSRPYFTVSDSILPISSPPTTRRVTVEVFDPASTRKWEKAGEVHKRNLCIATDVSSYWIVIGRFTELFCMLFFL
jgi:hypothetical protein